MTLINTRKRFSFKRGYSKKLPSGAVDTQLIRMPWAPPVQRYGIFTKIMITNPVGVAGRLDIWDQDLTNTSPPTAGSAGASLLPLEFGASAASGAASKTTVYTQDQIPDIPFYAGANSQSTLPGVTVMFEVMYI